MIDESSPDASMMDMDMGGFDFQVGDSYQSGSPEIR